MKHIVASELNKNKDYVHKKNKILNFIKLTANL